MEHKQMDSVMEAMMKKCANKGNHTAMMHGEDAYQQMKHVDKQDMGHSMHPANNTEK